MSQKIFMELPRIANAVFCQPWMIRPSFHSEILVPRLQAALDNPARHQPRAWDDGGPSETEEQRRARIEAEFNARLCAKQGDWMVNDSNRRAALPYNMDSASRVGQVLVSGIIGKALSSFAMECGGVCVDHIQKAFSHLAELGAGSVALHLDTPGGTVTGVPECAAFLSAFNEQAAPIHAFTDTMCCSAGYYLAASASTISVAPTADIGSIGVYTAILDSSANYEKNGLKMHLLSSGWAKGQGMRGTPVSTDYLALAKKSVMDHANRFFSHVLQSRGDQIRTEAESLELDPAVHAMNIMQGQDWTALDAPSALYDGFFANRTAHVISLTEAAMKKPRKRAA